MSNKEKKYYVMLAIVISFVLYVLMQVLSLLIYPPDFSPEFPLYISNGILLMQMGGSFLLLGLTIIGMKAEEEKETLAAAGFTALAISMGVAVAALFEIIDINSPESYEKFYYITVSSNFLFLPSILLITTYTRFQKWIKVFGLISSVPILITTVLFISGYRNFKNLELVTNTGILLQMVTYLLWAYNVYINYKKEKDL